MVFNATFNDILSYIVAGTYIVGGHHSARRNSLTFRKSLTKFIT